MIIARIALAAAAAAFSLSASAQEKYEIKLSHFVTPQHFMAKWLVGWGEKLEKASNGRLVVKHFPSAQMAPAPQQYDLARSGQAEVSWFLHGATPGRFPLTELISLPYMAGSAEIGTKALNDAELRSKYLDAEHRGVKVLLLLTHQPGNVHTTKKAIRSVDDFKGLRIRFAAATIRDFIGALGGTPVGVQPTEQLEQLQKGGLDGTFIDYGGAGIAFKMGGTVKYSTEMYSYVSSFGVAMNPDFYQKLPADLKKLLVDGGSEPIKLSAQEAARFRKVGEQVVEAKLKELSDKKLPAREVHKRMKALSEKHAKGSKNFWQ